MISTFEINHKYEQTLNLFRSQFIKVARWNFLFYISVSPSWMRIGVDSTCRCAAQHPVASLSPCCALLSVAWPGHLPLLAPSRRLTGWASSPPRSTGGKVAHKYIRIRHDSDLTEDCVNYNIFIVISNRWVAFYAQQLQIRVVDN